jgi:hypothetical protein
VSVRICFVNKEGLRLKTESLVDVFWLFFLYTKARGVSDQKYISLCLIKEMSVWRLMFNINLNLFEN